MPVTALDKKLFTDIPVDCDLGSVHNTYHTYFAALYKDAPENKLTEIRHRSLGAYLMIKDPDRNEHPYSASTAKEAVAWFDAAIDRYMHAKDGYIRRFPNAIVNTKIDESFNTPISTTYFSCLGYAWKKNPDPASLSPTAGQLLTKLDKAAAHYRDKNTHRSTFWKSLLARLKRIGIALGLAAATYLLYLLVPLTTELGFLGFPLMFGGWIGMIGCGIATLFFAFHIFLPTDVTSKKKRVRSALGACISAYKDAERYVRLRVLWHEAYSSSGTVPEYLTAYQKAIDDILAKYNLLPNV